MELWELSHEFSNINLKLKFTQSIGHISTIHIWITWETLYCPTCLHRKSYEQNFTLEKLLGLFSNSLSLSWLIVLNSRTNRKDMEGKLSWSI
jgi:hypothetical protein